MERRYGSRRRFLRAAGLAAVTGVAGCAGGDGGSGGGESGDGSDRSGGDGGDGSGGSGDGGSGTTGGDSGGGSAGGGQGLGPVPDEYATATAQDGTERSPDSVAEKSAVMYQSEPKEGQQCTDCAFYIPDRDGDGLGACAVVEGKIEPRAWCSSFVEYEG